MEIELREDGKEYPAITLVFQILEKSRSHPHRFPVSFTPYLISFALHLFNNPSVKLIWLGFPIYSMQARKPLSFRGRIKLGT